MIFSGTARLREGPRRPTTYAHGNTVPHGAAWSNLRTYLQVHEAGTYILRGYIKLTLPAVRTKIFSLHSFRHLAPSA